MLLEQLSYLTKIYYIQALLTMPIADLIHKEAAAVSPRLVNPSLFIAHALRKPMPVMILAASLLGSVTRVKPEASAPPNEAI